MYVFWYALCANIYTNRKVDGIISRSVNLSEHIDEINEEIVRWGGILPDLSDTPAYKEYVELVNKVF